MIATGKFVLVDNGSIDDTNTQEASILVEQLFGSEAEAERWMSRNQWAVERQLAGHYSNGYISIVQVYIDPAQG